MALAKAPMNCAPQKTRFHIHMCPVVWWPLLAHTTECSKCPTTEDLENFCTTNKNPTSCGCNQTMNFPNCQHALVPFCGPTQNLSQLKKCLGFPWGQERSRHGNYEQIFWHLVKWILECCLKTPTINSTQKSDTLLANFKITSSTTTTARKMLGFPSEMRRSWHRNCEQIF